MQFVKRLDEVGIGDIGTVGGKNASLGEMLRALGSKGVSVPSGFAVTADGYRYFIQKAGLDRHIRNALRGLNTRDMRDLATRGERVRESIMQASLPTALQDEILES